MPKDENTVSPVLSIPSSTSYWLIRADGGKYYNDFVQHGFIALAHNLVTIEKINALIKGNNSSNIDFRAVYLQSYPKDPRQVSGLRGNQIKNFTQVMSKGDVVLVPSKNSDFFALGVITSDAFDESLEVIQKRKNKYDPTANHSPVCTYLKRRTVLWIKEISKSDLPKGLLWALSAHEALFHITYSDDIYPIDKLFSPLFKKDNVLHLVIGTRQPDDLTMYQWNLLTSLSKETDLNPQDIKLDIQKNSPVTITFLVESYDSVKQIFDVLRPIMDPVIATSGVFETARIVWRLLAGKRGKELGLVEWCQEVYTRHLNNTELKDKIHSTKEKGSLSPEQKELKKIGMHPKSSGTLIEHETDSKKTDLDKLSNKKP
ncbi:hypothetical protein [Levilactobacillus brevis]|uniref:hypothetical protein n=1 Tax=Levilactobacillus brevis TaxID=1580 RepID=UPI001EF735A2|nr:hypothetical protein [Levilactobacillus brevis]ULH75574.1 hypothetical protein MD222_12075 [Levilactobacillus brevis]